MMGNGNAAQAVGLAQDPRATGVGRLALVGGVLLVAGACAWFAQFGFGLIETSGMDNAFVWGLMIAVFAFLVGFGAGSQLVSTAMLLTGKEELQPYVLVSAVAGLSCVLAAAIAVLVDLGAMRNIFAMLLAPNLRSPLSWDMVALTLFLVMSAVQLVMLALGKPAAKIVSVLAGLAAIALQVVEGLLFSLQGAHAWWATPIMPVDFLMVAYVSGAALVLLIAVVRKADARAVAWLGRFLAAAIAVHLVLALADLALVAGEGTAQAAGVLAVLQRYWLLYAAELALPAIAAVLLLVCARKGSATVAVAAAVATVAGVAAHRMMLLYPAYAAPSLYLKLSGTDTVTGAYPISTGRYLDTGQAFATASAYVPDGIEWLASLLPLGAALLAAAAIWVVLHHMSKRATR